MTTDLHLALDHLVVAAPTLEVGVDWCEATLGVRPDAGGRHAFMGTHNRVFSVASAAFPRAYFEIIAIDPTTPEPERTRWFDLDDPEMRRSLEAGPRLVHWVARSADIAAARATLQTAGIDCGDVEAAERDTPLGTLRWRITLRADGRRALDGAAPALIEWDGRHPTDALPASGVALESVRLGGWPEALALPAGFARDASVNAPPIVAVLSGPGGRTVLGSTLAEG